MSGRPPRVDRRPIGPSAAALLGWAVSASVAIGQPIVLLKEGQTLPGDPNGLTAFSIAAPTVNHAGGFAVLLNASIIWGSLGGDPTILRAVDRSASSPQSSFEPRFGLGNNGELAYGVELSIKPPGFVDSVWLDDTELAEQRTNVSSLDGGWYWRSVSRPGITADGVPYWVGGLTQTDSVWALTSTRGLFYGVDALPLLLQDDAIPGIDAPIAAIGTVGPSYGFSANGARFIATVRLAATAQTDDAVILGTTDSGQRIGLAREGGLIAAQGAGGAERWKAFVAVGVTGVGHWFIAGTTDAHPPGNEVLVVHNQVAHRAGQTLGGVVLAGPLQSAVMNENRDIALIWGLAGGSEQALFVNNQRVLKSGDTVTIDGAAATLMRFRTIDALAMSDRDIGGSVTLYFIASADTDHAAPRCPTYTSYSD